MAKFSVSIDDDVEEKLEEYADEHHDGVRSHAVEDLIERGLEYEDVVDELEHERARREDLSRQLAQVRSREDDVDEIVEYVDDERRYRRADLVTRFRWWLRGMPADVDDDRRDVDDRE